MDEQTKDLIEELKDLLSVWLEEAKAQEGEEVGAYANCAHDLNSKIVQFEDGQ